MADDVRPADDPVAMIALMRKEIDDLKSTQASQSARMPVGHIDFTILTMPLANALFMQGQSVLRTDYAVLFAWANDNGLVGYTGLFGNGDGSTTFTLPDWRGKVVRGVAPAEGVGWLTGADSVVMATAQMPAHNHAVSVAVHGNHGHNLTGGSIPGDGDHGGHFDASQVLVAGGSTYGVAPWNSAGSTRGYHTHPPTAVFADANSAGSHSVSQNTVGGATPLDMRQASVNVNYMIWT
jgi:hypothetical protein